MGIYFRDILLISISRGANNCGQHSLEKNIYFIMRFSPHLQLFYFSDRLEFCEFFEWKIKRINNTDLFSQTPFLTFIKGANISGGHCISNVYEECGSIIALSLLYDMGAHTQSFLYLIFSAERAYTPIIFGCAFCRLMQSSWMERVTTMNQLTDIRNKSAESLKTNNNKKKIFSDYVVHIGAFLY